jgi:hypothetical protein
LRAWKVFAGAPKHGVSGFANIVRTIGIGEGLAIGAVDAVALDANTAELIVLEAVACAGWNVTTLEFGTSAVLPTVEGDAFLARAARFG